MRGPRPLARFALSLAVPHQMATQSVPSWRPADDRGEIAIEPRSAGNGPRIGWEGTGRDGTGSAETGDDEVPDDVGERLFGSARHVDCRAVGREHDRRVVRRAERQVL